MFDLAQCLGEGFGQKMRYAFADCILDTDTRTLTRGTEPVAVEPQVFDLLQLMADNPDRVVTRDEIVDVVWGGRIVSESAISARIAAARKAVGDDGKNQAVIRTVSRRGLQMVADVTNGTDGPAPDAMPKAGIETQKIRFLQLPTGHHMAYAVIGSGPPVISVGHGRSDIEASWQLPFERERFAALAARNTVIRFDSVGSGQSDRDPERAGIAEQAEDIGHLADALGLERFAMCSHSGGCNALIHYAAHHPDRVSRIAMTGAYAEGPLVRQGGGVPESDPLRAMIAQGKAAKDTAFFVAAMLTYQPEGPLEDVTAFAQMVQNAASPEFELRVRDIINNHSSMALLHRIACPALILHARGDSVHPLSEAHKLARGIPGAELVVLECRNHIPMPGNAAYPEYLAAMTAFFAVAPETA